MNTFKMSEQAVDWKQVPKRKLRSGDEIPGVGIGTFGSDRFSASQVAEAVLGAIANGYRHIDCASVYMNEKEIGKSLLTAIEGGIKREDLWITSKVLILDEPSAVLTEKEITKLFDVIRKLTASGVGIVYISHRLEELDEIADRVTVMRDGKYIKTLEVEKGNVNREELIELMVGRELDDLFPKETIEFGDELLKLENVSREGYLKDINLSLHKGEILGIGGLVGAGRTELAKVIFGADLKTAGKIYKNGELLHIKSPSDAIANGIGLAPEDRKTEGLIQIMEIDNNINLSSMDNVSNGSFIDFKKMQEISSDLSDKLKIITPSLRQTVNNLSGGNQQKVVLAKWLATHADVIILDEPTRGIDVGAKVEVYQLMNELVKSGKGIIMISSELPELLAMSDNILVMHGGQITGRLNRSEATQELVLKYAAQGRH